MKAEIGEKSSVRLKSREAHGVLIPLGVAIYCQRCLEKSDDLRPCRVGAYLESRGLLSLEGECERCGYRASVLIGMRETLAGYDKEIGWAREGG